MLMNQLRSRFREGQVVRVKSGKLAGLTGTVSRQSEHDRSLLRLDALPAGVIVALDNAILEVVKADAPSDEARG